MQRLITVSCTIGLAAMAVAALGVPASPRQKTYSFRAVRSPGAVDLVEASLDVGGDLKTVEDGKANRMKMSVAASFVYDEKSLQAPSGAQGPTRSIRHYQQAVGVIKSGDHQYKPALRDERRLVGVEIEGPKVTLFSPQGTLTFEELELIDVLANSLLMDRLLPSEAVVINRPWTLSDELIAALLGLDTITSNDARSTLKEVADGRARFEISGRIQAAENGASTEIELQGKYSFDLERKRITWFGLLVRENRPVGHVDTGFDVVARLQMKITPGIRSEHLTPTALAGVSFQPTAELTQLSYEPAGGGWRLGHDRRWFVITEKKDQAVLRLIDGGQKLAQCNVASLPQDADAAQFTLEQFQNDVARGLGENFKSFVRASQEHGEADYRVFRVVAEGETSGIPMQWIYYLVTDKQGRRVVLVFVLEKEMLSRFGEADEKLVGTLRLVEPKIASKPASEPRPTPESGKRKAES